MKYMMLIYGPEVHLEGLSPQARGEYFASFGPYTQKLVAAGVLRGGEPLLPTSAATSVKVRHTKAITTHGPFAETTEQLLGFYILECPGLDEATQWAIECPTAQFGTIELRPVLEMPR